MTHGDRLRVVVAGGGVAGLETVLGLGALAGDRAAVTLLDPAQAFAYRPMTVAEPFLGGRARRYALAELAAGAGAVHVRDTLAEVDTQAHEVLTGAGQRLPYDVLVLALGARERPAFERALTFEPQNPKGLAPVLHAVEDGEVRRLAIVVPPGPHWTLPAYELALLLAVHAWSAGREDAEITVVVPEPAPLAIFGRRASELVRDELRHAGVRLETGAFAELPRTGPVRLLLHPGGRVLEVDRVVALPRLEPRTIPGLPVPAEAFLAVDGFGRVRGVPDVYAVGDGTAFPIKQGGLATQQADSAAQHIAARAGAGNRPAPFRPVLRGRLLTPHGARWLRHDPDLHPGGQVAEHALWWPPGKIAGRYLSPVLAARDGDAAHALRPPAGGAEVEALVGADG